MDICANVQESITTDLRRKMDTLGWYDEDGNIVYTTGGKPASEIACLVINSKTFGELCDAIDAVQANLERENETLRGDRDDGWVELPLDADGEPIHVGDVMVGEKVGGGYCEPFKVIGYVMSNGVIEPMDEHKMPRMAKYAHHHQPDTWERIIEDAINGHHGIIDFDGLVARCRALAGEAS